MFKASEPTSYVPSRSIAIKPEVVSDVGANEQIRISIPSFAAFVDPNQTFLKCNIEIKNPIGQLVPDPNGGIHSLFRNVLYRDGSNATTLELNEDYNANKSLLNHFTQTPSVLHKQELFSGVQSSVGNTHAEQTLYYKALPTSAAATGAAPDESKRVGNIVEVQTQLNSGIWKQGNILPVSAMNGMRIQIDTEDILRSCLYTDLIGDALESETAGRALTMTSAGLTAGDQKREDADSYFIKSSCKTVDNPFGVGDRLYIRNAGTNVGAGDDEVLGDVIGFSDDAGDLQITYVPARGKAVGLTSDHPTDSIIYYKALERPNARATFIAADRNSDTPSGLYTPPSYVLSDIEMVVQTVQPPAAYVEGLLRASQTDRGVSFDICTYELFRHNQTNTVGLMQAQIPTLMTRAKSLFSQPLVNDARNWRVSSLSGVVDNASNYEFIWGTQHYPSRLVPLERYNTTRADGTVASEALHISELQKAVVNIGEPVRNLQLVKDHFCVARSLTKYGQIQDLSTQTLSLRVDYQTAGASAKLFNNYIYGLRRITVSRGSVMVSQ